MKTVENKRLVWADSLKGWLITLVVLGHAIQYTIGDACYENHIWNLIYSFHMPAFMAVSGYLAFRPSIRYECGRECVAIIIKRRFYQLVVPYFLWSLCFLLVNSEVTLTTLGQLILYPSKVLWFLWVLFCINVIFVSGSWLAEKVKIKQEYMMAATCLFLAGVMVVFEIRMFGFQYISYYFLFYVIGYSLHKYEGKAVSKNSLLLFVLGLLWLVLAWYWQMHVLPDVLKSVPLPTTLIQYAYRYVTAAIAIYLLFVLSPRILDNENMCNQPLAYMGKVSLGIYAVHFVIIIILAKAIHSAIMNVSVSVLVTFVVALIISLVSVWLLSKWEVTNRLLLGNWQKKY